jgi:hypothetical protein
MEYLPIIYKLLGSSILALLIIGITYFLLSAFRRFNNKPLLPYIILFCIILVIAILIILLFLSGQNGELQLALSDNFVPKSISRELIISLLMVVSFFITRTVLIKLIQLIRVSRIPSFNDILIQWDEEKVSNDRVLDEQIIQLLRKSIDKKDETGWLELSELAGAFRSETNSHCIHLIVRKLWDIEKIKSNTNFIRYDYQVEEKLKLLLPRYAITPINILIEDWEKGKIDEKEINLAMLLNSFKKIFTCDDESGLQELKERLPFEKETIQQIAESEMWRLNREKHYMTTSEAREKERLKSLIMYAQV